jgi:DNA mismatch endonuclease (patch repair protein)
MADIHDIATRSHNMSKIKGQDTKPEILVGIYLYANGFRYRLHNKNLARKPDLTLFKYHTVIFLNDFF